MSRLIAQKVKSWDEETGLCVLEEPDAVEEVPEQSEPEEEQPSEESGSEEENGNN